MVTGKWAKQTPIGRGAGGEYSTGDFLSGRRPGFSLMEMLIVVAFLAVLLMMALPSLAALAPQYMVRSSAKSLDSLVQRARLMAYNTQKPVRVVVDCRSSAQPTQSSICLMRLYSANFNADGELDMTGGAWTEVTESRRSVPNHVRVGLSERTPVPSAVYTVIGDNTDGYAYWAVFLPNGRVITQYDPMRLVFSAKQSRVRPVEVGLSQQTGRVTVRSI